MSSIVTSILSSTIGLLWNKARDVTASKLKDGDITDTRIREMLVRELNDIKSKLDGLSRKDLLSSYRFLKEGVDLLNATLEKSMEEAESEDIHYLKKTTAVSSGVECDMLNEALTLSRAMGKLKIKSDKEFESAKKRFEEARKRATDAFCNEALMIRDRIFASKLRIVSEILECLDSPETAVTGCMSFLRDLQNLPAIRETFTVYLKRGVKSKFNKTERVDYVKSVMLINYVFFQFVSKFSCKHSYVLTWPTIELADRCFNPILHWQEVSARTSWGEELIEPPNVLLLNEEIRPYLSAVNSRGEIIVRRNDNIEVISRTGDTVTTITLPDPKEGEVSELHQYTAEVAVDENNNVYLVRWLKTTTETSEVNNYVLYVLDENYDVKHDYSLDLLDASVHGWIKLFINKDNIVIIKQNDPHVYVCNQDGRLKYQFETNACMPPILAVTPKGEIIVRLSVSDPRTVRIYTNEGTIKSTILIPEGHSVRGVAFQYLRYKIIVLTKDLEQKSLFLLCYSDTGELENKAFFCNWSDTQHEPAITSHPHGRVAVFAGKTVVYI